MRRMVYAAIVTATALVVPSIVLAQPSLVDGQVQKIDASAEKVTLRHGPIKNLDMDSMTMVFRVKDVSMLSGLKVGDKVKFTVDRVNGQITILTLEKIR